MIALLTSLVLTTSASCAHVPSARGYADTPPTATIVAGVLERSDDGTYTDLSNGRPLAARIDHVATIRMAPGQSYAFRLEGQARRLRVVPHAQRQYVFEVESGGMFGSGQNCFTVSNRTARPLEAEVFVDEGNWGQRRRQEDREVRHEYALSYRPFMSEPDDVAPALPSGDVDALVARANAIFAASDADTRVSVRGGLWEIASGSETRQWQIAQTFVHLNPPGRGGFGQESEPPTLAFTSAQSAEEQFRYVLDDGTLEGRARSRSYLQLRSLDAAQRTELFSLLYEIRRQIVGDPVPLPAPDWQPSPTRPASLTLEAPSQASATPDYFTADVTTSGTFSDGEQRTNVARIEIEMGEVLLLEVEADEGRRLHFQGGLGDRIPARDFREDGRAFVAIPASSWRIFLFVSVEREPGAGPGAYSVGYQLVDESEWLAERVYWREGATGIESTATVTGALSDSTARRPLIYTRGDNWWLPADLYLLRVEAGAPQTVRMHSDAFDAYLRIVHSSSRTEIRNDDRTVTSPDAQVTLTEAGSYAIYAGAIWPPRLGPYTLSVMPAAPGDTDPPDTYTVGAKSTPRTITDSTRVISASFLPGPLRGDVFALQATSGQTVRFQVNAEGFDPYIFIWRGDNGYIEAHGEAGTVEAEMEDLITGKYRILVGTLDPEATGTYTLHRELTDSE